MTSQLARTLRPSSTALYQQVVERILAGIESGKLSIGSALPPEPTLAAQFKVSRHTVREALRILGELGIVQRRPRIGTIISSAKPSPSYQQVIRSPEELLQYPPSRLSVLGSRKVRADATLAALLHCRRGSTWVHVMAVRRLKGTREPIGWLDLYLLPRFEAVVAHVGRHEQPVYQLLEQRFDQRTESVSVDLGVSQLAVESARALGSEPGTPSLRIVRRYMGPDGRIFQTSVTEHLPNQFQYRLQLTRGPDPKHRWAMQP